MICLITRFRHDVDFWDTLYKDKRFTCLTLNCALCWLCTTFAVLPMLRARTCPPPIPWEVDQSARCFNCDTTDHTATECTAQLHKYGRPVLPNRAREDNASLLLQPLGRGLLGRAGTIGCRPTRGDGHVTYE